MRSPSVDYPALMSPAQTVSRAPTAPSRQIRALLRGMRVALHVSVALLLAVALVLTWGSREASGVWATVLGLVFAAVYVAGTVAERRRGVDRLPQGWILAWLAVITLLWLGLVLLRLEFAWLVFPLFFLHLLIVGRRSVATALVLVALLTAMVVAVFAADRGGLDPGVVLGPVIGALVAVVMSAAYALFYREARTQQRIIAQLEATRADLARTERRAGVLAERQRWAQEVHDTVAQGLASVLLLSRAAQERLAGVGETDAGLTAQLAQMETTAAHSLAQARALVDRHEQEGAGRGRALADSSGTTGSEASPGLAEELAALARQTEATARQSGQDLSITVHAEDSRLLDRVPAEAGTVLLRVAQSALSNVLLHAQAHRCVVTLAMHEDGCSLDVHDDGRGRRGQPEGFGVRTMRRRAAELGGTLTVEDGAGPAERTGTVVALSLPRPGPRLEERRGTTTEEMSTGEVEA